MMPDREKIIKGLERCKEGGSCDGCQYDIHSSKCIFLLHADALTLLKELEAQIYELQKENNIERARKQWESVVDKVLENDDESETIVKARKDLFMGMFDDSQKGR